MNHILLDGSLSLAAEPSRNQRGSFHEKSNHALPYLIFELGLQWTKKLHRSWSSLSFHSLFLVPRNLPQRRAMSEVNAQGPEESDAEKITPKKPYPKQKRGPVLWLFPDQFLRHRARRRASFWMLRLTRPTLTSIKKRFLLLNFSRWW